MAKSEALALTDLLYSAACVNAVAGRQGILDGLKLGQDLTRHVRRLHTVLYIAAHCDGKIAIAPP